MVQFYLAKVDVWCPCLTEAL